MVPQTILNLAERKEGETLAVFVDESGDLIVKVVIGLRFGVATTTDSR